MYTHTHSFLRISKIPSHSYYRNQPRAHEYFIRKRERESVHERVFIAWNRGEGAGVAGRSW